MNAADLANPTGPNGKPSIHLGEPADIGHQRALAKKLFKAIQRRDDAAALQLAPQIHHLDSHRDSIYGDTPLLLASRYDMSLEVFHELLPSSNPLLKGYDGVTALILAAYGSRLGHSPEIVRLLLPGSNPLQTQDNGASALHVAAFRGSLEIFAMLLPKSDLLLPDKCGLSPLGHARLRGGSLGKKMEGLIVAEMARREAAEIATVIGSGHQASPRAPRL